SRHSSLGRYSYITADPYEWIWSRGQQTHVRSAARARAAADPFSTLAARLAGCVQEPVRDLPSFQGGAAGIFGYDLCHQLERLPRPRFDEFEFPDMAVGMYDWVVAFDHVQNRGWLISTGFPETDPTRRRRRAE